MRMRVVGLCQDVTYRYPATDVRELSQRGREVSEIGAAMRYPSYLERGPDYEAEMKYYHGDTLSPKDKVKFVALLISSLRYKLNE